MMCVIFIMSVNTCMHDVIVITVDLIRKTYRLCIVIISNMICAIHLCLYATDVPSAFAVC